MLEILQTFQFFTVRNNVTEIITLQIIPPNYCRNTPPNISLPWGVLEEGKPLQCWETSIGGPQRCTETAKCAQLPLPFREQPREEEFGRRYCQSLYVTGPEASSTAHTNGLGDSLAGFSG